MLNHETIMKSRFKCDDGIWRGVWKYSGGQYLMIMPDPKTKKNMFYPVPANWFSGREREEK